jgi:hypothetical protein
MSDTTTQTSTPEASTTPGVTTPDASSQSTAQTTPDLSSQPALADLKPSDSWQSYIEAAQREEEANSAPIVNGATANAASNTATANTVADDIPFESEKEKTSWEKRKEKYAAEARSSYEAELFGENGTHSWANGVSKELGTVAIEFARQIQTDPVSVTVDLVAAKGVEHLTGVVTTLAQDPTRRQELTEWALNLLGLDASALTGQPQSQPTGQKGSIPIVDDSGKVVGYGYTDAEVNARAAEIARAEVEKALSPFKKERETAENARKQESALSQQKEAYGKASEAAGVEVMKLPGAAEHKAAIGEWVKKNFTSSISPYELLMRGYHAIVGPKLKEAAAADYIKSVRDAGSAGGVSPSNVAASGTFDPKTASWADTIAHYAKAEKWAQDRAVYK